MCILVRIHISKHHLIFQCCPNPIISKDWHWAFQLLVRVTLASTDPQTPILNAACQLHGYFCTKHSDQGIYSPNIFLRLKIILRWWKSTVQWTQMQSWCSCQKKPNTNNELINDFYSQILGMFQVYLKCFSVCIVFSMCLLNRAY